MYSNPRRNKPRPCTTAWPGGRIFALLAFAAGCFAPSDSIRAQVTWANPGVGAYDVGANWVGGVAPQGWQDIVIANGGTAQASNSIPVSNVSVDGGSTLEMFPGLTTYLDANQIYLGLSGTGTLAIGSEALAATGDVYLGNGPGSTGVVSINGGTLSPYTFYAGYAGNGTATLANGATLESTRGYVGYLAGSHGVVNLSDSTWTATEEGLPVNITIGESGTGEVYATNSHISSLDLTLGSNAGSTGLLSANGGSVTVQNDLFVGNAGTGTLTLTNGATLTSYGLTVGAMSDSTGTLSVYGSTLTVTNNAFIGLDGEGTLTTGNAQIHALALFVGRNAGSTGTATVSGGVVTLTDDIHVGSAGSGTLTLTNGAILHSDIGNMGFDAGATGVVNILDSAWNNTRAIFIGVNGNGTLNIGAGGAVASESGYIAQNAGANGTVNIDGGSWAMTNTLVVGVKGTGHLSVTGGGQVGSVWSQLGLDPGSGGTVTLSNGSWSTTQTLTIGSGADGAFTAIAGSEVSAGAIELAAAGGVSGTFHVTNSTVSTVNLTAGGGTATARLDGVQLKLLGGSQVVDTLLIYGFADGAFVVGSGGLTVDTQGGNAQIPVLLDGPGALTKTGDGRLRLTAANTYGGNTTISGGVLEIEGNSALSTGDVALGTAELRAHTDATLSGDLNGGIQLVSVSSNQTGTFSAKTGTTLTLAPMDFLLVAGSTMQVGSSGQTGTVVFAPTGAVALPGDVSLNVTAGTLSAGNGALEAITSIGASTTVAAGATLDFNDNLTTAGINALFGAGTVNTGSAFTTQLTVNSGNFGGNIAGNGALVKESAGTLTLAGQTAFIGGTTVNGGTLLVNGSLSEGLGNATVNPGATLGGSGIVGAISLNGGSLSPGNSAGTLTAAELLWASGTLLFDLGPTQAQSDLLMVGTLTGLGTTYAFTFVDNGWVQGMTYNLINYAGTDIAIDLFQFTNGGGFDGTFAYEDDTLQFTLNTIPEPGTWALLAFAAIALAAWSRCRRRPAHK